MTALGRVGEQLAHREELAGVFVAEVARQFASGGVTGVRIDRADLESVFLALTGRSLRE